MTAADGSGKVTILDATCIRRYPVSLPMQYDGGMFLV